MHPPSCIQSVKNCKVVTINFLSTIRLNIFIIIVPLAEVVDISRDNLIARIWHKRKRHRYSLLLVSSNSPRKIALRITVMSLFGECFKSFLD